MSDFLTGRGATWHFVRRVPAAFSAMDQRGVVRHFTRIKIAEDRVGRRAARIAHTLNEELERFGKGLADSQAREGITRYDEVWRNARSLVERSVGRILNDRRFRYVSVHPQHPKTRIGRIEEQGSYGSAASTPNTRAGIPRFGNQFGGFARLDASTPQDVQFR